MKVIGYLIFALFYYIFYPFTRVKKDKVFCVATHDAGPEGNIGVIVEQLKKSDRKFSFIYYTKENRITQVVDFFIKKPYHLITSEYVLMDNVFLPMAFLHMKKKIKVVQLWHGTGTIKKFGQCANTGLLKNLEYHANQSITHLIVNSEYTKKLYKEAFGVAEDTVCVYGLPRTDALFNEQKKEDMINAFYQQYSELKDKHLVLYAPTFRDQLVDHPQMCLPINKILEQSDDDTVILLRLHPHVAANFDEALVDTYGDKVYMMSDYPDLNALLLVSDVLITDYSSIFYEYSLLGRQMIFYCYDLEQFSEQGRGFFEHYETFAPGNIARNDEELLSALKNPGDACEKALAFAHQAFLYRDGQATNRLIKNIFQE